MKSLHWPVGYPPSAPSSWWERHFVPDKNYIHVKKALDEQLQARPRPDPTVWGDAPLRVRIGLLVCQRLQDEYEWRNGHFIPDDPFDIAFMTPWDDLEVAEVVMDLEDELSIKIENAVAEAWSGKTLGDVVDTLLAKCKTASVKSKPFHAPPRFHTARSWANPPT